MISVIIPVLNESATVGPTVELARRHPDVTEVLVVDDGSIDGTPELAEAAGARVITSTMLGKGASMEDGMRAAQNEFLLFLDGDISGLGDDLVGRMTGPLLAGEADFVKAKFSRTAGRVTTLTARPLLRTFFPELAIIEQPLGGIIAARRSMLERLRFEGDYGVDVGLLIDAAALGAKLAEADIGHIEHDSHPLEVLGDMASQVVRVILDRAARHGRLKPVQIQELQEIERRMQAEMCVAFQKVESAERLALFDMDGVLVEGRFIVELARRTGQEEALARYLDQAALGADERTRAIASIFAGVPYAMFEQTAREMPLVRGASQTVIALRKAGFRVGIVTDSFRVAAETVRRRVFADFSFANLLRFKKGKATGLVTLAPAMTHPRGCPRHPRCKLNLMRHLADRMGIGPDQVVAVGDGENDVCLLEAAGTSIAFRPKSPRVAAAARHVVEDDLSEVLRLALAPLGPSPVTRQAGLERPKPAASGPRPEGRGD